MQALTGMFARQFGTPNYAAHGGFCSVNMAAGMIYTIGGSFWEFGGPDLERARLFVMIGTAEDHHCNPLKIALSKFKRSGGRFISINPVRTGYSAIADEWIPIKPGTDGALFMALLHELIRTDRIDHAFLKRFTNAPQLVNLESGADEGTFVFDPAAGPRGDGREPHNKFVWDTRSQRAIPHYVVNGDTRANANDDPTVDPALEGDYRLPDGTRVAPSFQLLRERVAQLHAGMGGEDHRHPGACASSAWRRNWPTVALQPGLHAADRLDRRVRREARRASSGGRLRSMRCAAWRPIRTASRRCARWRC